jgi:predicted dienelactone hydrolase
MLRRFALALALIAPFVSRAQDRVEQIGGRQVTVWEPQAAHSAPVVLFSHAFGGCPTQSTFLTKSLADHGYYVFAPRHADARCGGRGIAGSRPEEPFRSPERWNDTTYANRRDDMRAVEAALRTDSRYRGRVDMSRVAYVGHSLGGYTVLGLAGAWPSWVTQPPRAVVALSPYVAPFIVSRTLGRLRAPVMFQGGTLDFGITPSLMRSGGAYDLASSPKYLAILAGAGHLAWTDVRREGHEDMMAYMLSFLDHYVRGASATVQLTSGVGLSEYRYSSELGNRP